MEGTPPAGAPAITLPNLQFAGLIFTTPFTPIPLFRVTGYTVTFAPGKYNPNDKLGMQLIAEELFHVKQFQEMGPLLFGAEYFATGIFGLLVKQDIWKAREYIRIETQAEAFAEKVGAELEQAGWIGGWTP